MTGITGMILGSVSSCILALSEFDITTHKTKSQDSPRRSSCSVSVAPTGHNHPAFLDENNYHYNLSQSARQDQNALQLRIKNHQDPRLVYMFHVKQSSQNDSD